VSDEPYRGGIGSRREARERAFGLLYEAETKDITPSEVVAELPVPPEDFTLELIEGVETNQVELDATIRRFARDWKLERMPALDRALLRLGTFELVHRSDIPTGAVISEAVELAKRFSTDESGRFVNGMLSAVAAEARPDA
jgi:transcription antitermination protein NusB